MPTSLERIRFNLTSIRARIVAACRRAGRDPAEVTLVAVTKYAEPQWVRELVEIGHRNLGESRPQQLVERAGWFDNKAENHAVRWHLVGHLQRNKARRVLPIAGLIHSVDSLRLLSTLDRLAGEENLTPRLLLEVNVSGEDAKHGFSPAELRANWDEVLSFQRVQIAGLMTMAPHTDNPEDARPVFRSLRELRDELRGELPLPELSMGMSGDYEIGIEEGATLVRIGSSLFEGL